MPKSGDIVKNYREQTYLFIGHFVYIKFSVNGSAKLERRLASVYILIHKESDLDKFEDNFRNAFLQSLAKMYTRGKNIQNILNTPSNYRVVNHTDNMFGYWNGCIKANYKGKQMELEVVSI